MIMKKVMFKMNSLKIFCRQICDFVFAFVVFCLDAGNRACICNVDDLPRKRSTK